MWPKLLSTTGAGWVNFHDIRWENIEPRPPSNGEHSYRWGDLDETVQRYQKYGFRLVISLRMGNGWFAGPIRHRPAVKRALVSVFVKNSDRLPAAEHEPAYRAWIQALVERYDGDGKDDMPGLESAVLHYQIGNEYANPMFWTGTLEDYETLLKASARAAKAAHPDVRIISNGIRWNDLFHDDPDGAKFEQRFADFLARLPSDGWRSEWQRAREITEGTVALAAHFDILDAGGNGPYPTSSAGYMQWVRRELNKASAAVPIWDMEARSEPLVVVDPLITFHPHLQVPGGDRIVKLLRKPRHRDHDRAQAWYRAEQARLLAKTFVTRFAAGFEKVFLGMPYDWDRSVAELATKNPFIGLTDREGTPWPALHAFSLLVKRLDGFVKADKQPAPPKVELYRFSFAPPRSEVWAAWLREDEPYGLDDPLPKQRVRLEMIRTPAVARAIPTSKKGLDEKRFSAGEPLVIELGPTPVLIEPSGKKKP